MTGQIIDPFNGQEDLKNKVIRATTKHFKEDPLRVYRVARFAAQLGFEVEPETIKQMKELKSELNTLSKERVFTEFSKALGTEKPSTKVLFIERVDKSLLGLDGLQIVVISDKTSGGRETDKKIDFETIGKQCLNEINGEYIKNKYSLKPGIEFGNKLHEERIKWMQKFRLILKKSYAIISKSREPEKKKCGPFEEKWR